MGKIPSTFIKNLRQKFALPPKLALFLWLVLAPLLLMSIGAWQLSRVNPAIAQYGELSARLAQALADVSQGGSTPEQFTDKVTLAPLPCALIRSIEPAWSTWPPTLASSPCVPAQSTQPETITVFDAQFILNNLHSRLKYLKMARPLSCIALASAFIALLGGLAGLLTARQAGRHARQSRDALVAGFSRLYRMLPFLFCTVMLGLAAAALCAALSGIAIHLFNVIWMQQYDNKLFLRVTVVLLVFAIYMAIAAIKGIWALRHVFALQTSAPNCATGRALSETQAPALWRFVREIAARQNALVPDTIIIGLQNRFYVTEYPTLLLPENRTLSGRTLYLGAPGLEMFDEAELTAVIGHELTHFAGNDTTWSRRFAPIYTGLLQTLHVFNQADRRGTFRALITGFGQYSVNQFDYAVKHWSRLRELAADQGGSHASNAHGMASSLVRSGVMEPVVHEVLQNRFNQITTRMNIQNNASETGQHDGTGTPNVSDDLIGAMTAHVRKNGWPDARRHLEDQQPHPTDAHPPTVQRIQALDVALDDALIATATRMPADAATTPGARLVADWPTLRHQLGHDFDELAQNQHGQQLQFLQKTASSVANDALEIYHGRRVLWMVWISSLSALILLSVVLFIAYAIIRYKNNNFTVSTIVLVICALLFFLLLLALRRNRHLWKERNQPIFTLTPQGLRSAKLDHQIDWHHIDHFNLRVTTISGIPLTIEFRLYIKPETPLPQYAGASHHFVSIHGKRHFVRFLLWSIRGMTPAMFNKLIHGYITAARARQALSSQE